MVEKLRKIADSLERGEAVEPVSVREFLLWYGAERRGQKVVARIMEDLSANGLESKPDFQGAWIDGAISFTAKSPLPDMAPPNYEVQSQKNLDAVAHIEDFTYDQQWVSHDPSHQISKLAAANQKVISITPNATITLAVTMMLMHDFSQLPVMTSERELKGVISWKSIGHHLSLIRDGTEVRHAMEQPKEVRTDVSIFDVIGIVGQYDYVIVRDTTNRIAGIVTATDLSQQFRVLSEPFLLLSEIEAYLRNLIGVRFTVAELTEVRDELDTRQVQGVADMTFGEYVRLLESPDRWNRLDLRIDRSYFCGRLEFVRKTRNDVMHFDPDGIDPEQLRGLREFAQALRLIQ